MYEHMFVFKRCLADTGLFPAHCQSCGISQWRGRPLALELHHVNGNSKDNRLTNLALLCPNCRSQTDSWGGCNRERPVLHLVESKQGPSQRLRPRQTSSGRPALRVLPPPPGDEAG